MKIKSKDVILALKILLFVLIVLSPFIEINKKTFHYLHTRVAKIILLVLIVLASFIDLELAIILLIAFLVLQINFHKKIHVKQETKKEKFASENTDEYLLDKKQYPVPIDVMSDFPPDKCLGVHERNPEELNDHLFDIYSDPRVKPYDEFLRMMTNKHQLESAQDNTW